MIVIVGLGNPGKKYQLTRHNIGSRAVDAIAANFQFPIFNFQSPKENKFPTGQAIFNGKISTGKIADQEVILAKPQTFMNLSGKTIKGLIKNYKLKIKNLVVIHDDIDLPSGKIRIVKNRGSAGHKGVESIIKELKTKNFVRFRIGILPKTGKPKNPEDFVLQKFNRGEERIVKEVIKKTVEAIEFTLKESLEKAMSKFNK